MPPPLVISSSSSDSSQSSLYGSGAPPQTSSSMQPAADTDKPVTEQSEPAEKETEPATKGPYINPDHPYNPEKVLHQFADPKNLFPSPSWRRSFDPPTDNVVNIDILTDWVLSILLFDDDYQAVMTKTVRKIRDAFVRPDTLEFYFFALQYRSGTDIKVNYYHLSKRASNFESAVVQLFGSEAKNPCTRCVNGSGPWASCHAVSDIAKGSCGNCVWNSEASHCSLHINGPVKAPATPSKAVLPVAATTSPTGPGRKSSRIADRRADTTAEETPADILAVPHHARKRKQPSSTAVIPPPLIAPPTPSARPKRATQPKKSAVTPSHTIQQNTVADIPGLVAEVIESFQVIQQDHDNLSQAIVQARAQLTTISDVLIRNGFPAVPLGIDATEEVPAPSTPSTKRQKLSKPAVVKTPRRRVATPKKTVTEAESEPTSPTPALPVFQPPVAAIPPSQPQMGFPGIMHGYPMPMPGYYPNPNPSSGQQVQMPPMYPYYGGMPPGFGFQHAQQPAQNPAGTLPPGFVYQPVQQSAPTSASVTPVPVVPAVTQPVVATTMSPAKVKASPAKIKGGRKKKL